MLASTNIHQSAPNLVKIYDHKILDEFDCGSNWTQAMRVICPSVTVGIFDLVFILKHLHAFLM